MADSITTKLTGLDDLRRVLADIPLQMRKRVLLGALRKAARVPLLAARQVVPVMSVEDAAKYPNRTRGLLKKRLAVRTSRAARAAGNVGVFVNMRPATQTSAVKTTRGTRYKLGTANGRLDPFYWVYVEHGTRKMVARPFLRPAAATLPAALEVFMSEVIPQINKFNERK